MDQGSHEEATTFFDVPEELQRQRGEQAPSQGEKSEVEEAEPSVQTPQGENVAVASSSGHSDVVEERPRHVSFTSSGGGDGGGRVEEIGQPEEPKRVGFSDAPGELSSAEDTTGESSGPNEEETEGDTGGEGDEAPVTVEEQKVVEVFDPYYGLGLNPGRPEYPLQLVFMLMDSQRFQSSDAITKYCRVAKKVGVLVGLGVLLYYLALVDYHVRIHPRPPRMKVHYWSWQGCGVFPVTNDSIVRQQEEGMGNYYAYKLNCGFKLFLNITNPNHKLDLHYEAIDATILYAARPICYDRIENLYQPGASTLRPFFYLFTVGLPVPLNLGYELGPKLERGMYYNIEETIVFVLELVSRFTLTGSHLVNNMAYRIRWRCEFTLSTLSGKDTAKCWPLEGNFPPSHGGLRLYRTSAWPRTYTGLSFPMPKIPEYYDPVYNYAMR